MGACCSSNSELKHREKKPTITREMKIVDSCQNSGGNQNLTISDAQRKNQAGNQV